MTPEEKSKATNSVKKVMDKKDDVFFVDADSDFDEMVKADKAGKKLVFDIVDFPEVPKEVYAQLSRDGKSAYSMDARYSKKAEKRIKEGKSPYSDIRDRLIAEDPLHVDNAIGNAGRIIGGKEEGMHYIAAEPRHTDRMLRAGYKYVKPGEEEVAGGVKKGERVVLMGDNGKVDNVMMKVDESAYKKHVKIQGQKSQARLGDNLEATKEKMGQYGAKVTIYDDSNFNKIRPSKG